MKKLIVLLFIISLTVFAFAESKTFKHAFSIDLGGPATSIQLEYQTNLISSEKHYFGTSIGVGKLFNANALPLGLQYRFGKTFQIETGIHYTFLFLEDSFHSKITPKLGFRINLKRLFIHAYAAPLMNGLLPAQLWGGIGLGVNI